MIQIIWSNSANLMILSHPTKFCLILFIDKERAPITASILSKQRLYIQSSRPNSIFIAIISIDKHQEMRCLSCYFRAFMVTRWRSNTPYSIAIYRQTFNIQWATPYPRKRFQNFISFR